MTDFVELEREITFFIEAIEGSEQPLVVKTYSEATVPSRHEYADLLLPEYIDTYSNSDDNRSIYLWFVLQQLGYKQFGTLDFSFQTALDRFEFLEQSERYTSHRATEFEKFYATFELPKLATQLFEILETTRIETRILDRFVGAERLRLLTQKFYQEELEDTVSADPYSIPALRAGLLGITSLAPEFREPLPAIYTPSATVYDSLSVLFDWYSILTSDLELQSTETWVEEISDIPLEMRQRKARLDEWENDLVQIDNQIMTSELFLDPDSKLENEQGEDLEGSTRQVGVDEAHEREQLRRVIDLERSILGLPFTGTPRTAKKYHYHEWDYVNQVFLQNYCTVFERACNADTNENSENLVKEIRPLLPQVRKQFEQLKPTGLRRVKHSLDGDDIDFDSLLNTRIDLKAGYSSDERIFSRRVRNQRDVSAVFLVDLSASTDDFAEEEPELNYESTKEFKEQDLRDPFFDDDDDPYLHGSLDFETLKFQQDERKRILDVEREAVLLLATALEDLGDLYAIFGFSGYGHDNVEIEVAKEFNQTLNHRVVNGLANLKPMRSTRMGPAIRHAAWHLNQTGTAMKVLLVISDGFPQDHDYGPDRSSHEYGIQDTAKALQETHLEGIQSFCVTVDKSGHDYLRKMCPQSRYLVIEETTELPIALQKVYQQLSQG